MVAIFAFPQSLRLFRSDVIWHALFTLYIQGSLVEGQDVESSSRLFFFADVLFWAFSVFLQLSWFLNSLHFFYIRGSLVKGLKATGNSARVLFVEFFFSSLQLSCFIYIFHRRWV